MTPLRLSNGVKHSGIPTAVAVLDRLDVKIFIKKEWRKDPRTARKIARYFASRQSSEETSKIAIGLQQDRNK